MMGLHPIINYLLEETKNKNGALLYSILVIVGKSHMERKVYIKIKIKIKELILHN